MFPLPSILTTFRIPKKPRSSEDSGQVSKIEPDNSSNAGGAPDKLLSSHPKQNQVVVSSDRTPFEPRKHDGYPQEAGDTSFRCKQSPSQTINTEQKNTARFAQCKDDAVQKPSDCPPTTVASGEQRESATSSTITSPVALRRINFSEYISSKSKRPTACANMNTQSTNSDLSDKLSPLDAHKLVPDNPGLIKFTDHFYTDTLASLKHESRQVSDQRCPNDAVSLCNEDSIVLTGTVSEVADDVLMQESNIDKSPVMGNPADVISELTAPSSISAVTDQPSCSQTLSSILCPPGYQRISKKSVSWADAQGDELEHVQYFVSDIEGRRPRCLENIGKYEVQIERSIRFGASGTVFGDTHGFLTAHQIAGVGYGPLIEVALPPYIQKRVINSYELKVQSERQKVTLQDIFLPFVTIPSTPAEPDPNFTSNDGALDDDGNTGLRTLLLEPKIIPVDDVFEEEILPFSPGSKPIELENAHSTPVKSQAPFANNNCPAIPPSLRPELADLLSRAHQKADTSLLANHPLSQPTQPTSNQSISNPPLPFSTNSFDLFDRLKEVLSNEAFCRPNVTDDILSGLLSDKSGTCTSSDSQTARSNAAFVSNQAAASKIQNQMTSKTNIPTGSAPIINFVDFQRVNDGGVSTNLSGCYNKIGQDLYTCPAYPIDSSSHDQQPLLSNVPDRLKNSDFTNCGQLGNCRQRGAACMSSHGPIKNERSLRRSVVDGRGAPYHPPRSGMMRFQLRAGPPSNGQQPMRPGPPRSVGQDGIHQVWPSFVPAPTDAMCRVTCPSGRSIAVDNDFNARGPGDNSLLKGPRQMFGRFIGPSFRLSNSNVHLRGSPSAFDRRSGPLNYGGRFPRGQQRGGRPATRKYARGFPRLSSRPPAKRELSGNDGSGEWL